MKNVILLFLALFFCGHIATGQSFLQGAHTFSGKKESYFTLKNGEEIVGFVDDIDRKKGLIEEIKIKTTDNKKKTLKAKEIKSMFLAPSGFDKLAQFNEKLDNVSEWDKDRTMHTPYVKEGYVYFENCEVALKKGTMTLLMQMVNPGFAQKTKVFFDPYAKETTKVGVGGFTVAGGIDKSYYVQRGDGKAYKLLSKDYKTEYTKLFGDCAELKNEYAKKNTWKYFEEHVYFYDTKCNQL